MTLYLTREDILSAQDIQREEVEVPEWGGVVLVWGLTGAERDAFDNSMLSDNGDDKKVNMENFRAKLVARSIKDEKGVRLFSDSDINALAAKSSIAIGRVYDVAKRLSRLSKEDIDELTKNSDAAQNEEPGSD